MKNDNKPKGSETVFGALVLALRRLRGWSQEDLGEKAGISSGSISNYEQGLIIPSREVRQKIVDAFEIPFEDFDHLAAMLFRVSRIRVPRAEPAGRAELAARITGELAEDFRVQAFPLVLDFVAALAGAPTR